MRKTYYNEKPSEFYRDRYHAEIRLEITEITPTNEDTDTPQWSATVIPTCEPLSQNKFIETAMSLKYGNDYEDKLINEYNAAALGIYDADTSAAMVERYKTFLADRKSMKADIERICIENGIN